MSGEANECLLSKINDVVTKFVQPEPKFADVVAMHRLSEKADRIPAIVFCFSCQVLRDRWLQRKRMLKRSETRVHRVKNLTKQKQGTALGNEIVRLKQSQSICVVMRWKLFCTERGW